MEPFSLVSTDLDKVFCTVKCMISLEATDWAAAKPAVNLNSKRARIVNVLFVVISMAASVYVDKRRHSADVTVSQ